MKRSFLNSESSANESRKQQKTQESLLHQTVLSPDVCTLFQTCLSFSNTVKLSGIDKQLQKDLWKSVEELTLGSEHECHYFQSLDNEIWPRLRSLRMIHIQCSDRNHVELTNKQFPKLKQLEVEDCSNLSIRVDPDVHLTRLCLLEGSEEIDLDCSWSHLLELQLKHVEKTKRWWKRIPECKQLQILHLHLRRSVLGSFQWDELIQCKDTLRELALEGFPAMILPRSNVEEEEQSDEVRRPRITLKDFPLLQMVIVYGWFPNFRICLGANLPSLSVLKVENFKTLAMVDVPCPSVERLEMGVLSEIVEFFGFEEEEIFAPFPQLDRWFPNLRVLDVAVCPSQNMEIRIPGHPTLSMLLISNDKFHLYPRDLGNNKMVLGDMPLLETCSLSFSKKNLSELEAVSMRLLHPVPVVFSRVPSTCRVLLAEKGLVPYLSTTVPEQEAWIVLYRKQFWSSLIQELLSFDLPSRVFREVEEERKTRNSPERNRELDAFDKFLNKEFESSVGTLLGMMTYYSRTKEEDAFANLIRSTKKKADIYKTKGDESFGWVKKTFERWDLYASKAFTLSELQNQHHVLLTELQEWMLRRARPSLESFLETTFSSTKECDRQAHNLFVLDMWVLVFSLFWKPLKELIQSKPEDFAKEQELLETHKNNIREIETWLRSSIQQYAALIAKEEQIKNEEL